MTLSKSLRVLSYAELEKYKLKKEKWNEYMRNYYNKNKELLNDRAKEQDRAIMKEKLMELYVHDSSRYSMVKVSDVNDELRKHCEKFRLREVGGIMEELGSKKVRVGKLRYYINLKPKTSQE